MCLKGEFMSENRVDKKKGRGSRQAVLVALGWFGALLAARVLVVPLAAGMGLDESNQYLLIRPVAFVSDVVLLVAAFAALRRWMFPHTLAADAGRGFNEAWKAVHDPFRKLLCFAMFGAPLLVVLAVLLSGH
tara:strand:- start:355 stop:750 length:396 start_codon:yes stop_codon:yes gene_type:complete